MREVLQVIQSSSREIAGQSDLHKMATKASKLLTSPGAFSFEYNTYACEGSSLSIVSRNKLDIFRVSVAILHGKRLLAGSTEWLFSVWDDNPSFRQRREINFEMLGNGESWDINTGQRFNTRNFLTEKERKRFVDSFLQSEVDPDETRKLPAIMEEGKSYLKELDHALFRIIDR